MMTKNQGSALGFRLMMTVTLLFTLFAAVFVIFQYSRERNYRISLIDTRLHGLNDDIHILACHRD